MHVYIFAEEMVLLQSKIVWQHKKNSKRSPVEPNPNRTNQPTNQPRSARGGPTGNIVNGRRFAQTKKAPTEQLGLHFIRSYQFNTSLKFVM